MKKIIIFLILTFPHRGLGGFTFAQTDSVKVSFSEETVEKFEKTTLIDEYEKAFGGNRVVRSAIRLSFSQPFIDNNAVENRFSSIINYEKKLTKDVSVIAGLSGGYGQFSGFRFSEFQLESRWYFDMKKRIAEKNLSPNITGRYLSLKYQYRPLYKNNNYFKQSTALNMAFERGLMFKEITAFSINYGWQFGNEVNFGFTGGLKSGRESYVNQAGFWVNDANSTKGNSLFISSYSQVGLGLNFPRKKYISNNYCEFLKCNYEVKSLLKVNLNNAFYLDKYVQMLKADIGYERKIGKSPFSLNSSLITQFNNSKGFKPFGFRDSVFRFSNTEYIYKMATFSKNKINNTSFSIEFNEQLRYYIGMNRRISKGKSASNLNGYYTGLEGSYKFDKNDYPILIGTGTKYDKYLTKFGAILGYQTQTNKKSFVDIGVAFGTQSLKWQVENSTSRQFHQLYFDLNLKLGFAK